MQKKAFRCRSCDCSVTFEPGPLIVTCPQCGRAAGPFLPDTLDVLAEVRKLAERVTVLEGMVGELRRTVAELLRAPAMAAPAEQKKGYWR